MLNFSKHIHDNTTLSHTYHFLEIYRNSTHYELTVFITAHYNITYLTVLIGL